ncbi:MAG TPA: hypothetical protein PKY31_08010 [Spirochaetota bacterium]|nr:hypothetical protein [Spirochaetota bacterium]
MKKIIALSAALASTVVIAVSCSTSNHFRLIDEKHVIAPDTVAVIAGTGAHSNKRLVDFITDDLNKGGKFRAVSQERIAQAIPGYPGKLVDFPITEKEHDKPVLPDTIKPVLSAISRTLRVKYVFLVWHDVVLTKYSPSKLTLYAHTYGRFLEYPKGEIRAYSYIKAEESFWLLPFTSDERIDQYADEFYKNLAGKIVRTAYERIEASKKAK